MSKTGLEFILSILLIVSLILLGFIIKNPGEFFVFIEEIKWSDHHWKYLNQDNKRFLKMGNDNMVIMYKTVINGLTFFSCTCLICLSYSVSKK